MTDDEDFEQALRAGQCQDGFHEAARDAVVPKRVRSLMTPPAGSEAAARFESDPEALAWARSRVQGSIDKFRQFETEARNRGDEDRASQWRKFANFLQMDFIGGEGCVIAAFDERRPSLPDPG